MSLPNVQKNTLRCTALLLLIGIVQPHDSFAAPAAAAQTFTSPLPATSDRASNKITETHPTSAKRSRKRKIIKPDARIDLLKDAYQALSQGQLSLAEEKYITCLAMHPHEKDALLGLAVTYQRKLQNDRAARLYRQVLNEDMGNVAAAAGLISLSAEADPVAAESQLKDLLDIKQFAPELHYALGNVLAEQNRLGEAQQAFYRAYSLAPDNALYAYDLAVMLDRLHQSDAAIPYYEKALSLSQPGDAMLDLNAIGRRIRELKGIHQQDFD